MPAPASLSCQRVAPGSEEHRLTVELRRRVLRLPLGLDFSPQELAAEAAQEHWACYQGDALVGCFILVLRADHTCKLRQVAVEPLSQGGGVGRSMMQVAEARAGELGCTALVLHARQEAAAFYLKLGYSITGPLFTEVGLAHYPMEKILRTPPAPGFPDGS